MRTRLSVCFVRVLVSGLSPDLQSMEQIRRVMRPTDVPDQGLLCDLLWADPDKDVLGWGENDRGVSFTFGADVVAKFLHKHDMDLICRAHQVMSMIYCVGIKSLSKESRYTNNRLLVFPLTLSEGYSYNCMLRDVSYIVQFPKVPLTFLIVFIKIQEFFSEINKSVKHPVSQR